MAHAALTNTTALDPTVKTSSALFAQVAIVLIGLGVLVLMLGEPHLEGRNARASTSWTHESEQEIDFMSFFFTYPFIDYHNSLREALSDYWDSNLP